MNQHGRYQSPLRYPGGKGKVANYLKLLILENGLIGREYVEVYAGGASVALSLLFEDWVDCIHINDINPGVHAFWNAVLTATDEFCTLINATPVTVDEWHKQRDVLTSAEPDPLELGFAAFFLNRTNRSGIINGGVIGGLDQSGPWKIDARYNKPELIQRIKKVGRHRSRIELTQIDGAEVLRRWATHDEDDVFLYLDPPYFVKGQGLYDNFYGPDDHATIAALIQKLPHPWVVSYDAAPEIAGLYARYHALQYSLSYSAHSRGLGSEVMFFSPGLQPPTQSPSRVETAEVVAARAAAIN